MVDIVLFKVSVCQGGLGQEPTGTPTGIKHTIVPGSPTGALTNGENVGYKRGYFRNAVYAQVSGLFIFLYLHHCHGFD